jgi:ligand-binding sensor domain-containing protein
LTGKSLNLINVRYQNLKYKLRKLTFVFFIIILSIPCFSINISDVRHWSNINGLPNRVVKCLIKDQFGFIWIGTQNGLIRFDGHNFLRYTQIEQTTPMDNEPVNTLSILNDSFLWVGTDNGLFKINLKNYTSSKTCLPELNVSCKDFSEIRVFYTGPSNQTFIAGSNGVCWLMRSNKPEQITNPYSSDLLFDDIISATEDNHKNIWFTTARKQLYILNLNSKKIVTQRDFTRDVFNISTTITNGIVVSAIGGIYAIDTSNSILLNSRNLIYNNANIVKYEGENKVWLSVKEQQLVYHKDQNLQDISSVFNILAEPNYRIKCIYVSSNEVWVGTNFGLLKFTLSEQNIQHIFKTPSFKNDKKIHSVRGACELDDGTLLMATYEGVIQSKPPFNNYRYILSEKEHGFVPYALLHANQTVWIGSEGSGLIKYNLKTKKLTLLNATAKGIRPRFILCMINDSINNKLLLGTYSGLVEYDKTTNTFNKKTVKIEGKSINNAMIYHIENSGNYYWIGTSIGAFKCDKNYNPIAIPAEIAALENTPITSILIDATNSNIWLGSQGKGLFCFRNNTASMYNYLFKTGFSNDFIAGIKQSNDNNIWVTTYNGVSKINSITNSYVNLYTEQGLSHNEFNHGATYKTRDGTLFLGGLNGYNIIPKNEQINNPTVNEKFFISKIYQLNGNKETSIYICKNDFKLNLPTNNKILEIEFGIDDYSQPENNVFSYMLEGVDNDWIYIGNRNYIRFTDLKPGNYKLLIKASGMSGKWIAQPFTLNIVAEGYFYQKWWFIILVFSLVLFTVVIFYRLKLSRLNELANLRLQISSDLHDEVGSILTAVGMQAEILKSINGKPNLIALNKIAETSRTAVSNMRDVVWSIDARNDKCKDLLDRMHEYLSLIFDGENVGYTFNKSIENPNHQIDLVMRQNTYLIFKEALNNIVKHANATEVNINFTYNSNCLHLIIENNGKSGEAEQKMGMGIQNMQMRADKMKAVITIDIVNRYRIEVLKRF